MSMGLGGATRKLQKVADMGEELYGRINELREQILEMRETVQETNRRVAALENKVDGQEAILEALAEAEGIDVDEILTEVAIEEAETSADDEFEEIPDADTDESDVETGDADTESDTGGTNGGDEVNDPGDRTAESNESNDTA